MSDNTQKNTIQNISSSLVQEIKDALKSITFGSIEIYVQDRVVTQITVRNIRKTSVGIEETLKEERKETANSRGKIRVNIRA